MPAPGKGTTRAKILALENVSQGLADAPAGVAASLSAPTFGVPTVETVQYEHREAAQAAQ